MAEPSSSTGGPVEVDGPEEAGLDLLVEISRDRCRLMGFDGGVLTTRDCGMMWVISAIVAAASECDEPARLAWSNEVDRDEEVVGRRVRLGVVFDRRPEWMCSRWRIEGRLGVVDVDVSPEDGS